jgi:MerR family transcriptional regulator/heat shock protein HspR
MVIKDDEPCFTIGVVQQMVGIHQQTLRHYERIGLIHPHRAEPKTPAKATKRPRPSEARRHEGIRMYSAKDIERIAQIRRWIDELGVNLAGVEIMLKMQESMEQMRAEMEREMESMRDHYESELRRLKDALVRVTQERR